MRNLILSTSRRLRMKTKRKREEDPKVPKINQKLSTKS